MHIKKLSTLFVAIFACNATWAQTPTSAVVAEVKPTVETAATPVESIKFDGRSLPLNIKTLADIQRVQEEKNMREKLQEALTGKKATPQSAAITSPPASNIPAGVKRAASKKPTQPANTLLALYGTAGDMQAEIQTQNGQSTTVKKGDSFGSHKVKAIETNGITLVSSTGKIQVVRLGQRAPN